MPTRTASLATAVPTIAKTVSPARTGLRVLVVENDDGFATPLTDLLRGHGHQVSRASTAAQPKPQTPNPKPLLTLPLAGVLLCFEIKN